MNDQSPNEIFHASSFMQGGHNAEYLEQLYAQYAKDPPTAVDEAWRAFFLPNWGGTMSRM